VTIDTDDVVRHEPTGELWVVAYVDGERLAWCGWPSGTARLSDCTLVRKATPEQRRQLLEELAAMSGDDPRKSHAIRALEATNG
jgi:hypothetical protein